MKRIRNILLLAALLPGVTLAAASPAPVELTLIAPGGAMVALDQLLPLFTARSGVRVAPTYGPGVDTKRRVAAGEHFDVAVLQPPYPEVLASGHVQESGSAPLASVAVGVAVRKGTPKPDISTVEAVKKWLLETKSLAYPDGAQGAAAGVSFDATLNQLGMHDTLQPKLQRVRGGFLAMTMLANGEVESGVTFLSEMDNPGIVVVGKLPDAISTPTRLVAFIAVDTRHPAAAKALLQFLTSPQAAAVYRAQRMEPSFAVK